jgi:hypothetical protein
LDILHAGEKYSFSADAGYGDADVARRISGKGGADAGEIRGTTGAGASDTYLRVDYRRKHEERQTEKNSTRTREMLRNAHQ